MPGVKYFIESNSSENGKRFKLVQRPLLVDCSVPVDHLINRNPLIGIKICPDGTDLRARILLVGGG